MTDEVILENPRWCRFLSTEAVYMHLVGKGPAGKLKGVAVWMYGSKNPSLYLRENLRGWNDAKCGIHSLLPRRFKELYASIEKQAEQMANSYVRDNPYAIYDFLEQEADFAMKEADEKVVRAWMDLDKALNAAAEVKSKREKVYMQRQGAVTA